MLLRFIAKNIYSFKEETEFNLFPSCKATHHLHHKKQCNHTEALCMNSIYGANGAGKSNLIKAITDFRNIVFRGNVTGLEFQPYKFQFSKENLTEPISMAIEFFHNGIIYYYSIEFDSDIVSYESLSVSEKNSDRTVFERTTNGTQSINFGKDYDTNKKNRLFASVIQDKLLNKGALLLSFMAVNYSDEIPGIKDVHSWICNNILIIGPNRPLAGVTPHLLDINKGMMDLESKLLPEMKTGISGIRIKKTKLDEASLGESWTGTIRELKANPGVSISIPNNMDSRLSASAVYEDDTIILKELQPIHTLADGSKVDMPISFESDGTLRLIDYIPLIYLIFNEDCTVIIDEIERSLHPILIKEIISKISKNETSKGQLVFTTHESCLLDQSILRPDEIWFTEKDSEGATHLYPLSDFNIHRTANIEHGYLIGRYGGIPFLSNLKDLNW